MVIGETLINYNFVGGDFEIKSQVSCSDVKILYFYNHQKINDRSI